MKSKVISIFNFQFSILIFLLLMTGGIARAQVVVEGNVYGGCNFGQVTEDTKVTVNDGTIGKKIPLKDRVNDVNGQHARIPYGNVYGGGKGDKKTGTKNTTVEGYSLTVPVYDREAGLVKGNTEVTVKGDAVVRHAVYGGGNMSTVGVCTVNGDGVATYSSGGLAKVTITGNALIGPTKDDLTEPTAADLTAATTAFKMATTMTKQQYTDTAFKYLGANEGWVFGSSRGMSGGALKALSFVDSTSVTVTGNAEVVGHIFGGGENGHVQRGTNVVISGDAVIGGFPFHGTGIDPAVGDYNDEYSILSGRYSDETVHLKKSEAELYEDEFGVGRRVFRGNVFGGGKGTDFIEWWDKQHGMKRYCYTAGRVYGNTHVTISGNAKVYNRVYGGGTIASVGTFENTNSNNSHAVTGIVGNTGHCYVTIAGGTIGSPGSDGKNSGEVFGGGRGLPGRKKGSSETVLLPLHQVVDEAYAGHTHVEVTGGTVMSSVYGGSANGHVQGDTKVKVTGGTIGWTDVGGWHGNVFGGGGGTTRYTEMETPTGGGDPVSVANLSITAGAVYGNTYVTIEGGNIIHNVYGGGAIASVGTYDASELVAPVKPYLANGIATVTVTGGNIGTNGNNNGMVYGSGRGLIAKPGDMLDYVTYVAKSVVNIGKVNENENENPTYSGNAKINGSVYGSGENGHVYLQTQVNIYSGTIGCSAVDYAKYQAAPTTYADSLKNFPFRGNVYGAGCGTDQYAAKIVGTDTTWAYNPIAGLVQGNTEVNIYGGYISHNVYGAGSMASVGLLDHKRTVSHLINAEDAAVSSNFNTEAKAALSWPYELTFASIPDENFDADEEVSETNPLVTTGKATVNIYGGHIGTAAAPTVSGNVFGSARGEVGPLYHLDTLSLVRETEVNINYTATNTLGINDDNVIIGTVYGSGENGQTYEDTKVTIDNAFIAGSVFGGGKGDDTYKALLMNPNNPGNYLSDSSSVYSITAGKVYGNTEVVIKGGFVRHNVFGGGKNASVGKGNYMGYGELSNTTTNPVTPTPYEHEGKSSGKCTVKIFGGVIGTNGMIDAESGSYNGFVYGSSKGVTYSNITNTPRYNYTRDFFLAYTNKTEVIIGNPDPNVSTGPRIWGSVFGGGEDGHVRWNTDVIINKGEIGAAYTYSGTPLSLADSLKPWVYRGNVYGAGRGIDKISGTTVYCTSAGSVTLNTNVTVNGGIIHRNVYGGGSNASVGPPPTDYNPGTSLNTVKIYGGTIGQQAYGYGGDIFGGSRGAHDLLTTASIATNATSKATEVYIYGETTGLAGADIYNNVYGGGEIGEIKTDTKVYILGGAVENTVFGGGKGDLTDPNAALVLGNTYVGMTDGYVFNGIFGGGYVSSVGTFTRSTDAADVNIFGHTSHSGTCLGKPMTCAENTGKCTVVVTGGQIGPVEVASEGMPNPHGWVWGASCGAIVDPATYPDVHFTAYVGSTDVTIGGTAFIMEGVIGGGEFGRVLGNTLVKIQDHCQIGVGAGQYYKDDDDNPTTPKRYTDGYDYGNGETVNQFIDPTTTTVDESNALAECHHFDYGRDVNSDGVIDEYLPYDPYFEEFHSPEAFRPASTSHPSNGSTWIGVVYGGGSGYMPYKKDDNSGYDWCLSAGWVEGNSEVQMSGGHVLTNVYGGNEYTDVAGTATVTMTGGTIGVPRTIDQIVAHPVTCYLFGGGKGDERTYFNTITNVGHTVVNVSGGIIYGSVFGGAEDGHVLGNSSVTISGTAKIGTQGLSYVDGNVFGGGRGFSGEALTAGAVCGNVTVNISGGTMLGSIYGGGRLASVGTYLAPVGHANYGKMQEGDNHGFIEVNISGGKIGNSRPYIYVSAADFTTLKSGDLRNMTYGSVRVKAGKQTQADFDNILKHTISGNVYGGCMGRITRLDGTVNPIWPDLARCKKTRVTVSGNAEILSSVYGGGEIGIVCDSTTVNILGGTIGTEIKVVEENAETRNTLNTLLGKYSNPTAFATYFYDTDPNYYDPTLRDDHAFIDALPTSYSCYTRNENYPHYANNTYPHYYFGSVYGGGYGSEDVVKETGLNVNYCSELKDNHAPSTLAPVDVAGRVFGNTYVNVKGGTVRENVFGGGDLASVGTNVYDATSREVTGTLSNKGICTVTVGNTVADADYASAHDGVAEGDIIASPTIGPLDFTGLNGNVYAAGRGVAWDPSKLYNPYCNVDSTKLTVSGGRIWGSTFGGGADCHVLGNTGSFIQEGAYIGDKGITEFDGYVFGGGRNYYNSNPAAGRVQGNTYVVMTGGRLMCSIIGGGCMARVGVDIDGDISSFVNGSNELVDSANHGNTVIYVSGGTETMTKAEFFANEYYKNTFYGTTDPASYTGLDDDDNIIVYKTAIGTGFGPYLLDCDYSIGDIFGGGKGDTRDTLDVTAGRVLNTFIKIAETPRIMADIYAGGEMGCIGWYDITGTKVNEYYGNTGYTHVELNGTPYLGTPYEFTTTNFRAGVTWSIVDPHTKRLLHTCSGNVYGGGQGFVCDGYSNWVSMGRVRETNVTINGVRMMGHVFGGGSRGLVMEDASVTVTGGTIGCEIKDFTDAKPIGKYYYGSVFGGGYGNPTTTIFNTICDSTKALGPFTKENLVPVGYAGRICGNTYVNITGGQVMDCVFGGGDLASVGYVERNTTDGKYILNDPTKRHEGHCTVNVGGKAVIGPLDYTAQNAYVYGGGRGRAWDPEGIHNEFCNVNSTEVTIELTGGSLENYIDKYTVMPEDWVPAQHGGRIWGSVFGGGSDSHVLGDVSTTVTSGIVGTKGVTSYDGNIFGGGRDYLSSNYTNGRVGGNVEVEMSGGRLMGSIFGGGRLALTGVDVDGDVSDFMITDEDENLVFDDANHGLVTINVSGGYIGNPDGQILLNGDGSEYSGDESNGDIFGSGKGDTKYYDKILYGRVMNAIVNVSGTTRVYSSVYGGGEMAGVGWWGSDGTFVPNTGTTTVNVSGTTVKIGTELEYTPSYLHQHRDDEDDWTYMVDGKLVHACTGNVVGGSQGDVDLYSPHWVSFGRSRMSHVNISGTPTIMGNVYGGAEQGIVTEDAHVKITGGTIGTIIPQYTTTDTNSETGEVTEYKYPLYHFGGVYGGGYGSERYWSSGPTLDEDGDPVEPAATTYFYHDSCVFADGQAHTLVNMTHYLPATMFAGRVYGNTSVEISGGTIRENVFGGGNMATVGYVERDANGEEYLNDASKRSNGVCTVNITGKAIVGPLDMTGHNAYVFGAGKGVNSDPEEHYKRFCNVNEAHLTVNLDFANPSATAAEYGWNSTTDGRIYGSLFGGGGDCHVLGDAYTTLSGGLVGTRGITSWDGNIFGGGRNYLNSNHTNGRVQGNIHVLMNGGIMMGSIFGGGRMALSGIDVDGHYIDENHGNVAIWVSGKSIIGTNNSADLLSTYESCGDIFGAGKGDCHDYEDIWAGRVNNAKITVKDTTIYTYDEGHENDPDHIATSTTTHPTIHGGVFGGGEMASLGYWDDVVLDEEHHIIFHTTSSDFTTPGTTYGNNWGTFYENSGDAVIEITGGVTIGTEDELSKYTKPSDNHPYVNPMEGTTTRVYNESPYENPGAWTIYNDDGTVLHTCTGNVYGGSQGDVDISTPHWVSMGRSHASTVTIGTEDATTGPQIMGCVFGGGEQGIMTGNTQVTIYSGTIGTNVNNKNSGKQFTYGDVYGAGYGSDEPADEADTYKDKEGNNQDVLNDSTDARGTLHLSEKPSAMAGRVYGNTRVDMLGGTVNGSVYGGGSFASIGYEIGSSHGNTLVNIGLPDEQYPEDASQAKGSVTILGGVFGANNNDGTPLGNTNVHIYKTAHTTGNAISVTKGTTMVVDGNKYPKGLKSLVEDNPEDVITLEDFAELTDEDSTSLSAVDIRFALKEVYGGGNKAAHSPVADDGSTLVHVHYCEENTICDLYGGGNAADTKNNAVIVDGGRIHRVFGGGNGAGTGNPGANVSGTADTKIHGGFIDYVFGGSNQRGDIGTVQLAIDNDPEQDDVACQPFVLNVFGGSNDAFTESEIVTTIGCGARGVNFYGGSNNAAIGTPDVPVNVTLNVRGGVFTNIYGGSKGTYAHPDHPEDARIANIYGDVNLNFYSGNVKRIYGGSHENGNVYGKITLNVYVDDDIICEDGVNIDYVFGAGDMASYSPNDGQSILSPEINIYKAHINYEVYGGGSGNRDKYGVFHDAMVSSNPVVNIGPGYDNPKTGIKEFRDVTIGFSSSDSQFETRFPKDNGKRDISRNGNVFGGGNASPTHGSTKVSILNNSHIFGGVYGGGNNAVVTGNTDVQIGE